MKTPIGTFTTNTVPGSRAQMTVSCSSLWGAGQARAMEVLKGQKHCALRGDHCELVSDFGVRAARIAAAYARFYLELEPGCNPALEGRFYWMGLAAFASKQVMCGLDFVKSSSFFSVAAVAGTRRAGIVDPAPLSIAKNSLGKGNFWLFQDIYVWHWFYANYPDMFDQCSLERDASTYPADIKKALMQMPWAGEALGVIKNFAVTDYVKEAFKGVSKFRPGRDMDLQAADQYDSLMLIADHEQRSILQPLIYNDVLFKGVLSIQQKMEFLPSVPKRLAAFSTACDVDVEEYRVQVEEGDLYDENDRMNFIKKIARQYHKLMVNNIEYMRSEIVSISEWSNKS